MADVTPVMICDRGSDGWKKVEFNLSTKIYLQLSSPYTIDPNEESKWLMDTVVNYVSLTKNATFTQILLILYEQFAHTSITVCEKY